MFNCSNVFPLLLPSVFPVRDSYFAVWKQEFSHWSSSSWENVVKVVFQSGSKARQDVASPLILLLLSSFHCWIAPLFDCSNVFPLLPSLFSVRDSYFAGWKYKFSPWSSSSSWLRSSRFSRECCCRRWTRQRIRQIPQDASITSNRSEYLFLRMRWITINFRWFPPQAIPPPECGRMIFIKTDIWKTAKSCSAHWRQSIPPIAERRNIHSLQHLTARSIVSYIRQASISISTAGMEWTQNSAQPEHRSEMPISEIRPPNFCSEMLII